MNVVETPLPGVLVIEPRVFRDERGFFLESYNAERFGAAGLELRFQQDNHSRSAGGVVRGLHYQTRRPQGKLVSVVRGAAFDVAVDIRRGSATFGRWFGIVLSDAEPRSLWIPPGFAHGFCALSETVDITYKCTDVYVAEYDRGVLWSDPQIGLEWPVTTPLLSDKDRALPRLSEAGADLPELEQ